jgi:hypothetical protein
MTTEVAAEPDEARAKLWDELWATHEAARHRFHPGTSPPADTVLS